MSVAQITDHAEQSLSRLLTQLQGRPNISAIIGIFGSCIQRLENDIYPGLKATHLYDQQAQGVFLDSIGALVGLARNGTDDATYYPLLLGQIAENNSRADLETLLNIITTVFGGQSASIISCQSPGHAVNTAPAVLGFGVGSPTLASSLYPLVIGILRASMAAGVGLAWVNVYDATQAFAFAGAGAGLGFDDATQPGGGGILATTIYSNPAQ